MTFEVAATWLIALVSYLTARDIFRRSGRHVLALPVFTSVLLVLGVCAVIGISAADFSTSTKPLKFAMDLAVVGMAVPLQLVCRRLGVHLVPLMLGLLAAAATSVAGVAVAGWLLGVPWPTTAAVLPKAATMPVALSLVQGDVSHQAIAVASVFLTGLFGALLTPATLHRVGVFDERVHAFSLGVAAHAIGVVRAQADHPAHLDMAVAGMCGNALATAVLCACLQY